MRIQKYKPIFNDIFNLGIGLVVALAILFTVIIPTANADIWADSNYMNRVNRTVNLTGFITTNISDFPMPVFKSSTAGFLSSCNDYIFYNETSDGSLFHELDRSSCVNGVPVFWVRQSIGTVPIVSKDYYNYSSATADSSSSSTWDANFTIVLHMNESVGQDGIVRDSSQYGNNATVQRNTATFWNSTMTMGQALMINASGGAIVGLNITDTASQSYSRNFTIEVWIRRYAIGSSQPASAFETIAAKRPTATASAREFEFSLIKNADCTGGNTTHPILNLIIYSGAGGIGARACASSTNGIQNDGRLRYLAGVYNGTHVSVYIDGEQTGTPAAYTTAMNDGAAILGIGREDFTDFPFDNGNVIEEFRISNIARSPDWIKASYQAVMNASIVTTFGTVENFASPTNQTYISFSSPTNTTYSNASSSMTIPLIITMSNTSAVDKCWYRLNTTNFTITNCISTTIQADRGYNNITLFINNTDGTQNNSATVFFMVKDTSPPTFSLNSTNETCAGCNIRHDVLTSSSVSPSGYIFYFCNGSYSVSQAKCGNPLLNYTMSAFQTIGASNSQAVESIRGFIFRSSDRTLWTPYYNGSDLKIYLWNSTNGITWNSLGVVSNTPMIEPKGEGMTINSNSTLLFTWCDSTNVYFKSYNTKNQTYSSQQIIGSGGNGCKVAIAINETDAIFVASTMNGAVISTKISNDNGNSWTSGGTIPTSVGYHISINLYIDRFNNLHLLDGNASSGAYSTDYWNSTPSGASWGGYTQIGQPANDQQSDILVDFNGNRHIVYSRNPTCYGACSLNSYVYYVNSTGFGAFSSPINITTNATNGADTMWLTETNDSTIWVFYIDSFGLSQNNWCQYLRASASDMTQWNWTRISTNCRYPQPRGTTFPAFNSNDNSTMLDVIFANNTSPYYIHYFNITYGLGSEITNTSWVADPFAYFGATGWANVSKSVTDTIGATIGYYIFANTTDGGNSTSSVYYYQTTTQNKLDISAYNPDSSPISSWDINVSNATASYILTGQNNPTQITYNLLPQGSVMVNVSKSGYDSQVQNATISSGMGIVQLNFTLYQYSTVTFYDSINLANINNWTLTISNLTTQYISTNVPTTYVVSNRLLQSGNNTFAGSKTGYNSASSTQTINLNTSYNIILSTSQIIASIWAVDEISTVKVAFNSEFLLVNGNISVVKVTGYRSGNGCLYDGNLTEDCEQNSSINSPWAKNVTVFYGQDYNNATYEIGYFTEISSGGCEQPNPKIYADGHLIFDPFFNSISTVGRSYFRYNITVVNTNYSYNQTINFTLEIGSARCSGTAGYFGINEFRQINNTAGYTYIDNYTVSMPTTLLSGYNQYVVNFRGDPTIEGDYTNQRTYYLSLANNTNQSIIGYLLKDTGYNGFYQYWIVLDSNNLPIPDAKITIGRWYGGVDTTIGQCTSNLAGSCRIWLQAGQLLYSLRAEHPSYTTNYTATNEWTGSPNPAYIYLRTTGVSNFTSIYYGLTISLAPTTTYLHNQTNATCQVLASLSNLNYLNMTVFRYANGTTTLFGSNYNTNPSGTTMNILMNQNGQYTITCSYSWNSNATGTMVTYTNKQSKTVWLYSDNMEGAGTGLFDDAFSIFLVLFILLIVCVPLAFYSPTYAALVGIFLLIMFGWIGMLPDVMIGGTMISSWLLISLTVLTLIAFVFLKSNY